MELTRARLSRAVIFRVKVATGRSPKLAAFAAQNGALDR
jgi:hypothetical protein